MAAALPPVLIHDAVGQPPGLRAACGEGIAARALLLDFLPLRPGLLRLRRVCRSALALVAECNLSTQIAAGQVPVFSKPKAALGMVDAFPRASCIKVCINQEWTLQDFAACSHCSTLDIFLDRTWAAYPTFSGREMLQRLHNLHSVQLLTDGLTDASFRQLAATVNLALFVPRPTRVLAFSLSIFSLARSLRELSLHNFGDRVTHADLAPLAHQLTKLTLTNCPRVTLFRDFTALVELTVSFATEDIVFEPSSLPLQLQSLSFHAHNCRLTAAWNIPLGIALRSLSVECYSFPEIWFSTFPAMLEVLSISSDMLFPGDMGLLARLSGLRSLTCHAQGCDLDSLSAEDVTVFSQLETLAINCSRWHMDRRAAGRLSKLKHLTFPYGMFVPKEVLLDMPVLETLHLSRWSCTGSEADWNTSSLLVCFLRKPSLKEATIIASARDARALYDGLISAVSATPGARMWWKPDLTALRFPNQMPERTDRDGDAPDGWFLCADGDGLEHWEDGMYSCTKEEGIWSARVQWPTPAP